MDFAPVTSRIVLVYTAYISNEMIRSGIIYQMIHTACILFWVNVFNRKMKRSRIIHTSTNLNQLQYRNILQKNTCNIFCHNVMYCATPCILISHLQFHMQLSIISNMPKKHIYMIFDVSNKQISLQIHKWKQ